MIASLYLCITLTITCVCRTHCFSSPTPLFTRAQDDAFDQSACLRIGVEPAHDAESQGNAHVVNLLVVAGPEAGLKDFQDVARVFRAKIGSVNGSYRREL